MRCDLHLHCSRSVPVDLPLLPLVTAVAFLHEQLFARRQQRLYLASLPQPRRGVWRAPSGPFGPAAASSPAR